MPKSFSRTTRVADLMQREISKLITLELRDSGIGMVTLTHMKLAKDFSQCTVLVSVLPDDKRDISLKILNEQAYLLRMCMARTLTLRTTPKLIFVFDEALLKSQRIQNLIDSVYLEPDTE